PGRRFARTGGGAGPAGLTPRAGAPGRGRAPAAAGRRATLGGTETARPLALIPLEEAVAARYSARELLERTLDAGSFVSRATAPVDVEPGPRSEERRGGKAAR